MRNYNQLREYLTCSTIVATPVCPLRRLITCLAGQRSACRVARQGGVRTPTLRPKSAHIPAPLQRHPTSSTNAIGTCNWAGASTWPDALFFFTIARRESAKPAAPLPTFPPPLRLCFRAKPPFPAESTRPNTPPRRNSVCPFVTYIYRPPSIHLPVLPLLVSGCLSIPPTNRVNPYLLTFSVCLFSMHLLHPSSPDLPGSLVSSKQARAEVPTENNAADDQADMPDAILDDISHRRFNPLRGSWVLVSPHRTKRPWQGAQEAAGKNELPDYDQSVSWTWRPGGFAIGHIVDECSSATYVPATNAPRATSTLNMTERSSSSTTTRR